MFAIRWFNRIRSRIRRFIKYFKRTDPIIIVPYIGHGTSKTFYLQGRVLETMGLTPATAGDSAWTNFRNVYRRFASDEIRFARIRASYRGQSVEVEANDEGFFNITMQLDAPIRQHKSWQYLDLELVYPPHAEVRAQGQIRVLSGADYGVISDIDDTVLQSSATARLRMIGKVLFSNAYTRLPFAGVSEFYRALVRGHADRAQNPIFYVSSSPWNLYDVLVDFLAIKHIPVGPLFLKDWSAKHLGEGHAKHKLASIHHIFDTHPKLSFVLIGDSGEQDPEIYREVALKYRHRILVIYIRHVTHETRAQEVQHIARELALYNIEMVLVPDTLAAAQHAQGLGLIASYQMVSINSEQDENIAANMYPLDSLQQH